MREIDNIVVGVITYFIAEMMACSSPTIVEKHFFVL